MGLHCFHENHFVMAESSVHTSTLYSISTDGRAAKYTLAENILAMGMYGEKLLCISQLRNKKAMRNSVILHTFDMDLHEISQEVLIEDQIWHYFYLAAMNTDSIFILQYQTNSISLEECRGYFDEIIELLVTQIDLATGVQQVFDCSDFVKNSEWLGNYLHDLACGFVTGVNSMHISDGRLMLECDVYYPDCEIETNDPDFDESELDDFEYVEWHTFPDMLCVDVNDKTITSANGYRVETPEYNAYSWNDRLVSKVWNNGRFTGFRIENPETGEITEIKLP